MLRVSRAVLTSRANTRAAALLCGFFTRVFSDRSAGLRDREVIVEKPSRARSWDRDSVLEQTVPS